MTSIKTLTINSLKPPIPLQHDQIWYADSNSKKLAYTLSMRQLKGRNGEVLAITSETLKSTYLGRLWVNFTAEKSSVPCRVLLQMIPLCFMRFKGVEGRM